MSVLVLSPNTPVPLPTPDGPFHQLVGLSRADLIETRPIPAHQRRQLVTGFVDSFQWYTIRQHLPLQPLLTAAVPDWQPRRCRSWYRWLPPEDVQSAADFKGLDDFDLILRLFRLWRQSLAPHPGPALSQPLGSSTLRPRQHGLGHTAGLVQKLVLAQAGARTELPRARPGLL